jgi:hypothetical protein
MNRGIIDYRVFFGYFSKKNQCEKMLNDGQWTIGNS